MFYLTEELRRHIRDAAARRVPQTGTPFADAPQASVPKAVPYWQPGTLYQPGDLVQANELGRVARANLTNPGFESGDTGWIEKKNAVIEKAEAFQGDWRGRLKGGVNTLLCWIEDATMYATTDFTTVTATKIHPDIPANVQASCVSSGGRIVVVVPGDYRTTWAGLYWTEDGTSFTKCTGLDGIATYYNGNRIIAQSYPVEGAPACFLYTNNNFGYYQSRDGKAFTLRQWGSASALYNFDLLFPYPAEGADTLYLLSKRSVLYYLYTSTDGGETFSFVLSFDGMSDVLTPWYLTWALDNAGDVPTLAAATRSGTQTRLYSIAKEAGTFSSTSRIVPHSGTGFDTVIGSNLWSDFAMGGDTLIFTKGGTDAVNTAQHGAVADAFATLGPGNPTSNPFTAFTAPQNANVQYVATLGRYVGFTNVNTLVTSTDGRTWTSHQSRTNWGWSRTMHTVAGIQSGGTEAFLLNTGKASVQPGQRLAAQAQAKPGNGANARIGLRYYNAAGVAIHDALGPRLHGNAQTSQWHTMSVLSQAPEKADTVTVLLRSEGEADTWVDQIEWDHYDQSLPPCRLYEATQTAAKKSGTSEPLWPGAIGGTVTDGGVTWTAKAGNCITWEAVPILRSGATEPVWPTEEGASVADGSILWTADSGRVRDVNCPNQPAVVIAAGKVFCADDDIVAYSATTNPLDWSARDDAGYVPFGLQPHGGAPAKALALYRGNLVIWSEQGFQLWQVDEDPARFALLDAVPIGSRYHRTAVPVSNDLVWLSSEGVRNFGTAGAQANLQAGYFGKAIDPLVQASLAARKSEDSLFAFFYPGAGQYWLVLGATVYVLTMNGGEDAMSWSRYTFPSAIEHAALADGELYLRSGDRVWQLDDQAVADDEGGTPHVIEGRVWWHYLDAGVLGVSKEMTGFDVVATGTYQVSVGYQQADTSQATAPYTLTGDTVPGMMVPLPVVAPSFQLRLTWSSGAWEWRATSLYLNDSRAGA